MGIPQVNILNLNKSRQRAVYWRTDKEGNWMQTTPLPADPASANYYIMKGFKANRPEPVEETPRNGDEQPIATISSLVEIAPISCPICGFGAKSSFGLQVHLKKHTDKEVKI